MYDHSLAANATVTLEFSVEYLPTLAAGTIIENRAHFSGENNDDGNSTDAGENGSSGVVPITVPTIRAVDIDDTGTTASGDADNTDQADDNDVQSVDSAAEGSLVIFNNILTNNGNASDTLEVSILNDGGSAFNTAGGAYPALLNAGVGAVCDGTAGSQFPAGTTFTLTNGSGVPYAGNQVLVASGASVNVQVRAQLPAGANGAGEYCASTRVRSQAAPTVTDYKLERLSQIVAPAIDVANQDNSALAGDIDPIPAYDIVADNAAVVTQVGNPGDTVTFDVWIRNDGGASESFTLNAGATWDGTTLGGMHAGWSIQFRDNDAGTPTPNGTVITSTDLIPAGGTVRVQAVVTIPAVATDTQADFSSDIDGGGVDIVDDNADGDGDYPIIITATGNNGGAVDAVLNAVDVNEVESVQVDPSQSGQVEPGGTITYVHTLANLGNTDEDVSIAVADNRDGNPGTEPNDFNASLIRVDTTCNGVYDTILTSVAGNTDNVCLAGDAPGVPTGDYDSGAGTLAMAPGDSLPFQVTVSAQSSAPTGVTNTTTVTATWDIGVDNDTDTAADSTLVVTVQLRIFKYAAQDAACDGTPDEAFTVSGATATAPGQCVIWQIVIENQSSQAAREVVISDAAPAFTLFETGSLESCNADAGLTAASLSANCTAAAADYCAHTDGQDAEACASTHAAHEAAEDVFFYVGHADGANPAPDGAAGTGGSLLPGESVTVRFRTVLDSN